MCMKLCCPGSQMVHQWFINGLSMAHQWFTNSSPMVHQWFINDSPMVHQWLTNGSSMAHQWFINGLSMAHQWFIKGLSMAHQWFINGLSMAHQWLISGSSMAHQWFIDGSPMVHQWFPTVCSRQLPTQLLTWSGRSANPKIEPPYNNSNMRIVPAFFLEYSPQPRYPGPGCNPKINTIYAEITMENALPTIVLTKKKKKIKV